MTKFRGSNILIFNVDISKLLESLENVRHKDGSDRWYANCPNCDYGRRNKSGHLYIRQFSDGGIYTLCFKCQRNLKDIVELFNDPNYKPIPVSKEEDEKNDGEVVEDLLYRYCNKDGSLQYYKKRLKFENGKKKFMFYHWEFLDGRCQKVYSLPDNPVTLYNLQRISKADSDTRIFIVEGEKCCNAMAKIGLLATSGNAGADSKIAEKDLEELMRFKEVVIIPDNDEAGWRYVKAFYSLPNLKVLDLRKIWADCPPKSDIADFIEMMLKNNTNNLVEGMTNG